MNASKRTMSIAVSAMLQCVPLTMPSTYAQSPQPDSIPRPEKIPDEMQTLVVATRFVPLSATSTTANDRFKNLRIPVSAFNETDHCIDQSALDLAQHYFNSLGRSLSKAGHYYFIPSADMKTAASFCEKTHRKPPRAWIEKQTEVIAFGKRVPTTEAAALELQLR